jgi:hypothetical protein
MILPHTAPIQTIGDILLGEQNAHNRIVETVLVLIHFGGHKYLFHARFTYLRTPSRDKLTTSIPTAV